MMETSHQTQPNFTLLFGGKNIKFYELTKMEGDEEINIEEDLQLNDESEATEPTEHETNGENQAKESPNQKQKIIRLPLSRIKTIMKLDPDCALVSQDSAFLVTKATEMFIEFLAKESGKQLASIKRKTLMRRDVDIAIQNCSNLCFLDGAIDF